MKRISKYVACIFLIVAMGIVMILALGIAKENFSTPIGEPVKAENDIPIDEKVKEEDILNTGETAEETEKIRTVEMLYSSEEIIGRPYIQFVTEMKAIGFAEFDYEEIEDLTSATVQLEKTIAGVKIGERASFQKGDKIPIQDKVTITYHVLKRIETPLSSDEVEFMEGDQLENIFREAGYIDITTVECVDLDPDEFDGNYHNKAQFGKSIRFDKGETFPFDTPILIEKHKMYEKYTLTVEIEFANNLLFNRHDVMINVANQKTDTIKHGKDAVYEVRLKQGEYPILFTDAKDVPDMKKVMVPVDGNTRVRIQVSCHWKGIEVVLAELQSDTKKMDNEGEEWL